MSAGPMVMNYNRFCELESRSGVLWEQNSGKIIAVALGAIVLGGLAIGYGIHNHQFKGIAEKLTIADGAVGGVTLFYFACFACRVARRRLRHHAFFDDKDQRVMLPSAGAEDVSVHMYQGQKVVCKIFAECEQGIAESLPQYQLAKEKLEGVNSPTHYFVKRGDVVQIVPLDAIQVDDYLVGALVPHIEGMDGFDFCQEHQCLGLPQVIELAEIFKRLHAARFAHRDVKPENLIIDNEGHIHLIDLDMVCSNAMQDRRCGTPETVAPEVGRGREYDPQRADVYSLGRVIYEMWGGRETAQFGKWRRRGWTAKGRQETQVAELLNWMLFQAPGTRPDMSQVVDKLKEIQGSQVAQ